MTAQLGFALWLLVSLPVSVAIGAVLGFGAHRSGVAGMLVDGNTLVAIGRDGEAERIPLSVRA
jgi:hypothetical protein